MKSWQPLVDMHSQQEIYKKTEQRERSFTIETILLRERTKRLLEIKKLKIN